MVRPLKQRLVYFDTAKYIRALRRELKKVNNELKHRMYRYAKRNLGSIPFKDNKVKLFGGSTTSDRDRKAAVMQSIIEDHFESAGDRIFIAGVTELTTSIRGSVSALASGDYKDTHIGLYYEYGTGTKASLDGPFHIAQAKWNVPFRPIAAQAPIVSRSRAVNGGIWYDIGGNMRVTSSPKGGMRTPAFIAYVGEDTEAHHWFRNAYEQMRREAVDMYRRALREVNPMKFMQVSSKIVLGAGRWS